MPTAYTTIFEPLSEREKQFAAEIEQGLLRVRELEFLLRDVVRRQLQIKKRLSEWQQSIEVLQQSSSLGQQVVPVDTQVVVNEVKQSSSLFSRVGAFFVGVLGRKGSERAQQSKPSELQQQTEYGRQWQERLQQIEILQRAKKTLQTELLRLDEIYSQNFAERKRILDEIISPLGRRFIRTVRLAEFYPNIVAFCRKNTVMQEKWLENFKKFFSGFEPKRQANLNPFDWFCGVVYYAAYCDIIIEDDFADKERQLNLCLQRSHKFGCFLATMEYSKVVFFKMTDMPGGFKFGIEELLQLLITVSQAAQIYPVPGYYLMSATCLVLGHYYKGKRGELIAGFDRKKYQASVLEQHLMQVKQLEELKLQWFRLSLQYCYMSWILASIHGNKVEIYNAFIGKNMVERIISLHGLFDGFADYQKTAQYIRREFLPTISDAQVRQIKQNAAKNATVSLMSMVSNC